MTPALKDIVEYSKKQNSQLTSFAKAFSGKAFDGVKLFEDLTVHGCKNDYDREYAEWFRKNYGIVHQDYWDTRALRYDCTFNIGNDSLKCKDYAGGRLSWYSFDEADVKDDTVKKEADNKPAPKEHEFYGIPTLATYSGAPNKRLGVLHCQDLTFLECCAGWSHAHHLHIPLIGIAGYSGKSLF
mgnify:CR=1 FL=1